MADQPLLEVNCTNCPGNQACEDCVVRFFLAERDGAVVSLAGRAVRQALIVPSEADLDAAAPAGLPAELADAFALLQAAGMAPELLGVEEFDAARAS